MIHTQQHQNRYLFEFDESNNKDIIVHDVSDLENPVNEIAIFQYSDQAGSGSYVHNGQVRGNFLHVAYYAAGFRIYDISNPKLPVETGMIDTAGPPTSDGAWNTYPYLPRYVNLTAYFRSCFYVKLTAISFFASSGLIVFAVALS